MTVFRHRSFKVFLEKSLCLLQDLTIRVTICIMKRREQCAVCPQEYLSAFSLNPDRVIYFDIETTGFRPSTSSLYMIGWAVHTGSSWTVTQILSESSREEALLLSEFARVLHSYDTLVAFNGDRFDLPYMREKYELHNMEDPFAHMKTVDLYREIRPFRHALGMTRLNQKSVEQFLGISREDPYTGGELIDVYRSVRDQRCTSISAALDALFLHNLEDVTGMMEMTPLLSYRLAIDSMALVNVKVSDSGIEASYPLAVHVPEPLHLVFEPGCSITLQETTARISIRMLSGCLYHYFPDYRNYYYLPEEDTAIHKSVSSFVDPAHREKATAQTSYVKKEGTFLPMNGRSDTIRQDKPLFRRYYKDPVSWFEYLPGMEEDPSFSSYLHDLVRAASGT